jgi:hypothetical protein
MELFELTMNMTAIESNCFPSVNSHLVQYAP